MRINLHVSLVALLFTMGSLSLPSWSMESSADQGRLEDNNHGEKRKRENGEALEKVKDNNTPKKRTRKFNRKRQIPSTGFNNLPPEMQAEVWAHTLAQGGVSAYRNLSPICKFSRACTQDPSVLRRALSLAEPRIVWDQEQDKQDQENQPQVNQSQESQVQDKQEQDNKNPTLSKFLAIKMAPYPKPYDATEAVQINPLLIAMKQNPTSHALVYHLAAYLYELEFTGYDSQQRKLEQIVPSDDLDAILSQMQKTKDFLVSGLLKDREMENPFDKLKYEAFLKLHYVLQAHTTNFDEEMNSLENEVKSHDPWSEEKAMEEEFSLEGELKKIQKTLKLAIHNYMVEDDSGRYHYDSSRDQEIVNEAQLELYNITQLRLITLLSPHLELDHRVPFLKWLAAHGDLESLRHIIAYYTLGKHKYLRKDERSGLTVTDFSCSDELNASFWYSQIKNDKNHPLYTEALYWLGMLYLNPDHKMNFIIPNRAKGISLLKKAAEAGQPLACLEIGKRNISGSLFEQDIDKGTKWVEEAARLGEPSIPSPSGFPPLANDQQEVAQQGAIPHLRIAPAQPIGSVFWGYDLQADTNNPGVREEEDAPMLNDLFGDSEVIGIPEEVRANFYLTQENDDMDLGN